MSAVPELKKSLSKLFDIRDRLEAALALNKTQDPDSAATQQSRSELEDALAKNAADIQRTRESLEEQVQKQQDRDSDREILENV